MGRSGDEQVAKSAPHHWIEALDLPLRDGGEINNSVPVALKLSRPTMKAPNVTTNTSRITLVIYSQHRLPTADSLSHKHMETPKTDGIQPPTTEKSGEEETRDIAEPGQPATVLQAPHCCRKA